MMKYDVVCFGEMLSCDLVFAGMEKLPEYGEEQFCEQFAIMAGGSANTPIALSKLGLNTAYMTRIGDDFVGNIVYEELKSIGVCTDYVRKDKEYNTCVSAVLSATKDRAFATYFDDSPAVFSREEIKKVILESKAVYTDVKTCVNMPTILEAVKEYKKDLYLDIGTDENQKLEDYIEILKAGKIFFPNDKEALALTKTKSIQEAIDVLHQYLSIVVIKRGKEGCTVSLDGKAKDYPAYPEFEFTDSTGAGDSFCAGFVYASVNNMDLDSCAALANASGGLAVTYVGGNSSSYTKERVFKAANVQ